MGDVTENAPCPKEGPTPQSLVTTEHVVEALRKDRGPEAQLVSWFVKDFTNKGDNYASVVSSVEVKFTEADQEAEVVYVVKLNPCRSFESFREFTQLLFEKEVKFYLEIVPSLNRILENAGLKKLQLPRCIHGSLEEDRELIFLEDLRPQGFKMFDRKKGLDVAHATLILQELGKLHAASVLLEAETPDEVLSEKYPFLKRDWAVPGENSKMDIESIFDGYLSSGIDLLKAADGYERAIAWVESLRPQIRNIFEVKLGPSDYNVVCHGDCWNNNVLFRYDDEGNPLEVMLVDLQCCRYTSPVTDLNYLLYTSVTGEVRRPHLRDFLSTYFASFRSVLSTGDRPKLYTEEKLWKDFRGCSDLAVIFCMMLLPIILMDPEDVPELSNRTDDEIGELMDELKQTSQKMFNENPRMRPRFLAMFDEFMEDGIIP